MTTFIHSDSPISKRTEDRLGYSPFARALAKAIVDRPCGDGFVVGIQAAWGMGKSSAINLMIESLEELEQDKPKHEKTKLRNYNPWLSSGFEALARGYLSELGRVIEETVSVGTPHNTRKTVEKLIKGGSEMIGGLAALAAIAVSHGAAAPIAGQIKSGVSGALNLGAYAIDNRSLDSIRDDLSGHLANIDCKLLVIIDDLDRLQADELRQILTLAKTFGNLPNVIHLLVYDRNIIDNALVAAGRMSFREKIVQVELDLPPPARYGLRGMTFDRMTAIVGENPPMDRSDWTTVAELAFGHYLDSPRDVTRIANAISVSWPGLEGEVYLPDFFALELLRHFERPTYDLIRQEREILLRRSLVHAVNGNGESTKAIMDSVSEPRREAVKRVLVRMFPNADFGRTAFQSRSNPPPLSGRRVGDPRGFDAYFQFAAPPSEVTMLELREIARKLDDPAFLKAQIETSMVKLNPEGGTMAARMLNELGSIIEGQDSVEAAPLIAVLGLADHLIELKDEAREIGVIDNFTRLRSLLEIIIVRLPEAERGQMILNAVSDESSSIPMAAYVAAALGQDHGLVWQGKRDETPVVSEDWAKAIGNALTERIESLAAVNRLPVRSGIATVLRVWATYRDPDAPRRFVASQAGDPQAILAIAFAIMADVTALTQPGRYRELRSEPDRDIYDLELLTSCIERHLLGGRIDTASREDAEHFIVGANAFIERRKTRVSL